jgi:hypothetical protein
MIKLTINPGRDSEVKVFNKKIVIIGSKKFGEADLNIESDTLQPIHLQINEEENRFTIHNVANDPFATLNEFPFGRKTIKNYDIIQIGSTLISFEGSHASALPEPVLKKAPLLETSEPKLAEVINKSLTAHRAEVPLPRPTPPVKEEPPILSTFDDDFQEEDDDDDELDFNLWELEQEAFAKSADFALVHAPITEEVSQLSEETTLDVEALIKEVEELESESHALAKETVIEEQKPPMVVTPEPIPLKAPPAPLRPVEVYDLDEESEAIETLPPSIKNSYDKEKGEEENSRKAAFKAPNFPSRSPKKRRIKRLWFMFSILLIIMVLIISFGVYTKLQQRSLREELQAAKSISDLSLALTYAKINHIKPEQQNWTDPHFLKASINSVLSPHHTPEAFVDNHGRINNGSYLLRIYINGDLSRFVVIAQPEAGLIQWIAAKNSIVLDSSSMELRKISDIKTLNRLLVNLNSLKGDSDQEIFNLIQNGELIPLASLADKNNKNGFAPPKALEIMRPSAENLVYNAPRYSRVGDKIMQEAIDVQNLPKSSSEVKKLYDQIRIITKLPNVVIYTSRGMNVALKAQKSLVNLFPEERFLIAYQRYNKQNQSLTTHLIVDNTEKQPAYTLPRSSASGGTIGVNSQPLTMVAKASEYLGDKQTPKESFNNTFQRQIDKESPLYLKVSSLAKDRQSALEPLADQMIDLLNKNNKEIVPDFTNRFHNLVKEYDERLDDQKNKVFDGITKLYHEYHFMPLSEFARYVNSVGLKGIAESKLTERAVSKVEAKAPENDVESRFQQIKKAKTFNELDQIVTETSDLLTLDNALEIDSVIRSQNKMRTHVLDKLNEFLLTSHGKLPQEEYNAENRVILKRILENSWITDTTEQGFYLDEFDQHQK